MNKLTKDEKLVMLCGFTEKPFSGEYNDFFEDGLYVCKNCDNPLFISSSKFESGCGWPSFDSCVHGSISRLLDADGVRVEVRCCSCGAHLGHVFEGEGFTSKGVRYCVNSISMKFIPGRTREGDS